MYLSGLVRTNKSNMYLLVAACTLLVPCVAVLVPGNLQLPDHVQAANLLGLRGLRNNSLLLVQALADRRVLPEQGMSLAKVREEQEPPYLPQELASQDILFRQQLYPGVDSSLAGVRGHYSATVVAFLSQCLGLQGEEEEE